MNVVFMRRILAVVLALLAGCAAPGPQPGEPHGWVVFSLVQEVAFAPAYLRIRPVGAEGDSRGLGIFLSDAFGMQNLDGHYGVAKAVALKPGTYEIYNFFLEQGGMKVQYRSRHDFSLRFEVRENAVSYVGQFLTTRTRAKGLVDWITGPTPYFLWSDHRARDVAAAAKATPEIQALPSRTVPLEPVKPTPLIRATRAD